MRNGFSLLLIGLCLALGPAHAGDVLTIPGHVPVAQKQIVPRRGISMDRVLEQFGEPDERRGPVGEPPITEWNYGSFRVYFEHNLVLHTVDLNTLILPR